MMPTMMTWPPSSKSLPISLSCRPTTHWPPTSAMKHCVLFDREAVCCLILGEYLWCDARWEVHSWQQRSRQRWQQRCLVQSWCRVCWVKIHVTGIMYNVIEATGSISNLRECNILVRGEVGRTCQQRLCEAPYSGKWVGLSPGNESKSEMKAEI